MRRFARCYSSEGIAEVLAKHPAASKAPSFDQIVSKWSEYPSVVAQLQQINNVFGELHKDSQWADIEKQFKHDPSSRTIDWDYLQENLKYPEIIAAYKESLDKIKFQDIEVDSQFGEMDALVAQYSADIRAQNKKYQEKLPQLERDIAHTEQFKANIRTMTVEEQRPHDPKIFQEIDQELDAWNWDDEPIVAETHGKH